MKELKYELLKYANSSITRTKEEKQAMIIAAASHYGAYMTALGIDWENDPNSSDTPMRVAKAFVNDLAQGFYEDGPRRQLWWSRTQGLDRSDGRTQRSPDHRTRKDIRGLPNLFRPCQSRILSHLECQTHQAGRIRPLQPDERKLHRTALDF